jgi:glycosyltransferase involved in cell wall biosynthesis
MHVEKGVDTLLHALARLDPPEPVRVLLGGEGPHLARFRALAASLAPRRVELSWLGWVAEPRRFYEALDLAVVPSRAEAFSLVPIEAWERGVPVLASDAGGLRELVAFSRGAERELVFRAGDPEQLADRLRWFLARRAELGGGDAAAERHAIVAREFDAHRVVREYEALFEEVIAGE